MKDNKIDRLFKERLANQKVNPPAHLWGQIEEQIPNKSKRAAFLPWAVAASILLTLGFGYIGITQLNWQSEPDQLTENQLISPAKAEEKTVSKATKEREIQTDQNESLQPISPIQLQRKEGKTTLIVAAEPERKSVEQLELIQPKSYTPLLEIVAVKPGNPKSLKGMVEHTPLLMSADLILNTTNYLNSQAAIKQTKKNNNKFGFVRSLANLAKSVDKGAEALNDLREAKNEWVNETLITEGESEDSPHNKPLN